MPAGGTDGLTAAARAVNAALEALRPDERRRVLDSAYALWVGSASTQPGPQLTPPSPGATPKSAGTAPTPRDFMVQKQPTSDVELIACLAYYLTHHRSTPRFKTKDLEVLNSDAHRPKIPNPTVAVDNATKEWTQYLSQAGGGLKQITPRGEALVEVLPDRAKVKEALKQHPLARRVRRKRSRANRGR